MESKRFSVELLWRQRIIYEVEAADPESAEAIAISRWHRGDGSDLAGMDWSHLGSIRAVELADGTRASQDEAVVLRFLRERERALARFGSQPFGGGGNDAISAQQVAADLGWVVPVEKPGESIDVARAARTLESLCTDKKLVCFERQRARSGERGSIRLYCTPEYLEALSRSLFGGKAAAGL